VAQPPIAAATVTAIAAGRKVVDLLLKSDLHGRGKPGQNRT
jgi:hypothetical protein